MEKQAHTQRIQFLDFAKGIAIFFMIMQHAMIMYGHAGGEESVLGIMVLLLGTAPAAPVFMFTMGIFFARAKSTGMRAGIIRGLKLVALGYVLNLCRFNLPLSLVRMLGEEVNDSLLELFLTVDILQLAGVSLIVMAFLKQYMPRPWVWLGLAAGISLLSPLLWGKLSGVPGCAVLWGTGKNVYFPVFPWLVYPLAGMVYGTYLLRHENQQAFLKRTFLYGLLLLAAGLVLQESLVANLSIASGSYYRHGAAMHLIILGFVLMWLPVCRLIVRTPDRPLFRLLYFWSRKVTVVYFIQWTLIGWGIFLFNFQQCRAVTAVGLGLFFVLVTDLLTRVYGAIKASRKRLSE